MKNNVIKRNTTNIKYLNKKTGKVEVIFRDITYNDFWTYIKDGELWCIHSITHLRTPELYEIIEQGVPEGVVEMKEQIKKLYHEMNTTHDLVRIEKEITELKNEIHRRVNNYYNEMINAETAA